MNNELIPLNIKSYNYKERKAKLELLDSFYFPKIKISAESTSLITTYTVGTIIRKFHKDIWYDIPFIKWFEKSNIEIPDDAEFHNFYKNFLEETYKTSFFYIVREDFDFKSVLQISEEERLKQTYYECT